MNQASKLAAQRWPAILASVLLAAAAAGCADADLDATYGRRTGLSGGRSVNGTAALGGLLAHAGYQVESRRALSPELLEKVDTIVWCPDDFALPDTARLGWMDRWLRAGRGRTLVYIGRDFDAEPGYWSKVIALVPTEERGEIERRRSAAQVRVDSQRTKQVDDDCSWFSINASAEPPKLGKLEGPWSAGVDSLKADVRLRSRMIVPDSAEVLLESNGETLAAKLTSFEWGDGRVILVANGSFLLNAPLVNHEHRKLAAHLVREVSDARALGAGHRVVVIESESGGPAILSREPGPKLTSPIDILRVRPWNYVVLHLAALGIIFCFSRLPIFGKPRKGPQPSLSDFGKHVTALGDLLHKTRDFTHATTKLEQYRQAKTE